MHYTLDSPNGEGLFVWGNVQKRYLCPFQECQSGLLSIGAVGNNVQWWRDPDWFDKAILNCVLFFLYVWQALTFQRKIVVLNEIQENKGGGKPPNITMDKCPKHSKIKKKKSKDHQNILWYLFSCLNVPFFCQPLLGWACELGCVRVELYITPPSIHLCNVGLASLWHVAAPPYGETGIFKGSYLFCHNTYIQLHAVLFPQSIWSWTEEQTPFEIQYSLKSMNFIVDADGKMFPPLLVWKYGTKKKKKKLLSQRAW